MGEDNHRRQGRRKFEAKAENFRRANLVRPRMGKNRGPQGKIPMGNPPAAQEKAIAEAKALAEG